MGEILIAGTAALLICIFLSPKFIEFLRNREFGQYIREEGPEGHHEKAGTPTMGGIIIFTAVSIPFLILSDYDWRSVGVYGAAMACALLGFADDYTKIVKRRSLGLRARTKLARDDRDLARPVVDRDRARPSQRHAAPALARRHDRPRRLLPAAHLPRGRGHDERGQPHRRPRRPGRRLRGDRRARLHRDHVHHAAARPTSRCSRAAWSGRASASCGSTPSRRRSSWATPARSGSAARSPASR